jgi:hypothetical protein
MVRTLPWLNGKYVTKDMGLAEGEFPSHKLPTLTFEGARAAGQAWFETLGDSSQLILSRSVQQTSKLLLTGCS